MRRKDLSSHSAEGGGCSPTLFVFVYLCICISNVGNAPPPESVTSAQRQPTPFLRMPVTIRSASLNTIKFPVSLCSLSAPTPTPPPSLQLCFSLCSHRCSMKELETASSNAASVEKPSSTSITLRSIFVFTAVSEAPAWVCCEASGLRSRSDWSSCYLQTLIKR